MEVFENVKLRRLFGPRRGEVIADRENCITRGLLVTCRFAFHGIDPE
jgi:hypothetical protein